MYNYNFYLWLYLKTGLQSSCQFNTWLPYQLQHTSGLSHFRHGNGQYLFHGRGRGQAKPELQYFPFRIVLFCWAASCSRPKPPHPTQTHSKHFPAFLLYLLGVDLGRSQHSCWVCISSPPVLSLLFAMMYSIVTCTTECLPPFIGV